MIYDVRLQNVMEMDHVIKMQLICVDHVYQISNVKTKILLQECVKNEFVRIHEHLDLHVSKLLMLDRMLRHVEISLILNVPHLISVTTESVMR